jgi:hypothetical protein
MDDTKLVFDLLNDRTIVSSRLVLPNQAVFVTRDGLKAVITTHGVKLHASVGCICGRSISFGNGDDTPQIYCDTCGAGWDTVKDFLKWQEERRCTCGWFPTEHDGGVACPFCANEWLDWNEFREWKENAETT